jgi:hypothetical protein
MSKHVKMQKCKNAKMQKIEILFRILVIQHLTKYPNLN